MLIANGRLSHWLFTDSRGQLMKRHTARLGGEDDGRELVEVLCAEPRRRRRRNGGGNGSGKNNGVGVGHSGHFQQSAGPSSMKRFKATLSVPDHSDEGIAVAHLDATALRDMVGSSPCKLTPG